VTNDLPFDITIWADDFIDADTDGTELKVAGNGTKSGKIYTSQPNFVVVPLGNFPKVTYTITGGTMYVTIMWKKAGGNMAIGCALVTKGATYHGVTWLKVLIIPTA
jgi:hypothetical protein